MFYLRANLRLSSCSTSVGGISETDFRSGPEILQDGMEGSVLSGASVWASAPTFAI